MRFIIAAALLTLCVAMASAQGFGRGQGGMRGGMQMGNSEMLLLQRQDVKDDLKITAEQQRKLDAIQRETEDAMRSAFEGMRGGGGGGDFQAIREQMEKMRAETGKKVAEVLTPEQNRRLREIGIQVNGNRALLNPEVQKELALTDTQKRRLTTLQNEHQEANRNLMMSMRDSGMDREELRERMAGNDKVLLEELGKVLTAEQAAKFKGMAGEPFKQIID